MLSREFIRTHPDVVRKAVEDRGDSAPIDEILTLDQEQRELKSESEALKAERNRISKSFADKGLDDKAREDIRARATEIRERIGTLDQRVDEIEHRLHELELWVPNVPDPSVPVGKAEEDNVVRRTCGTLPEFSFKPRPHYELGEMLGIYESEAAVSMSGSRFHALKGTGARMARALADFMLDLHVREHGFTESWIPYIVSQEAMIISAQLPKFADESYRLEKEDMYLIPTAEVPLVNLEAGKILDAEQLPVLYTALSPSFRREAGAAGRETRGMIRVHQFEKVEMVVFCRPDESAEWLERLVSYAEDVLQRLGLAYHVLEMNTSDLGFGQVKKYDPEVWMPAAGHYVEISSCSNMGDFQARRGKIRYRPAPGESPKLVHTLNGSGVAVGRCLAAIWENYQQEDGSIIVPEALVPYMDGVTRITKSS